jgi:hypothetical protein
MLSIYSNRIQLYLGLAFVLAAACITPTQFLWAVFGYSIIVYLPVSLTTLLMSLFVSSFRDPERYRTVLGVPTNMFCAVVGVLGLLLVAYYPFADGFAASRVGMLMSLAALETFILRREATIRHAAARRP